jgi:hypothetical protein
MRFIKMTCFARKRPTFCVDWRYVWTGSTTRAGVDSAWKQEKLEARKMLENAADWASEPLASIAQPKAH